jgi:pilus assembly protein Flp/PilA
MKSSIARATAIEYGLIASGIAISCIVRFLHDGAGATATEYGLIAAGISVAIVAAVQSLGPKLFQSL